MKTEIPHVNTIPDLSDRLRVKRGAGVPIQLFLLIPIVGIMFWYLFMARAEVLRFYATFNWESLVHPFGYLVPIVVFLSLSIALKLHITWRKRTPSNFRIQRQAIVPRVMLAGAITVTLFTATLASAAVILIASSGGTGLGIFFLFLLIPGIFVMAFLAAKTKEELEVLRHYLGVYWQRVRVTATFDKAAYRPGDVINVQVRDRLSENSATPHRVHLSYVEEKIDYTGVMRGMEAEYRRMPTYNEYRDVTAAELHRGVTLRLPEPSSIAIRSTALEAKRPRYWEVLVEEHGGRYYSRFFVDTTK